MKVLYLGDIVGRTAREAVYELLPDFRRQLALDLVLVNGENAAGGFGITPQICDELFDAGTDVILTGNHVWDQKEIIPHFQRESRLLRPMNFPQSAPGRGVGVFDGADGQKAMVIQVMGRIFMDPLDDPFAAVESVLADIQLVQDVDFILVDIHGEASSEKMAMGQILDGRVSAVVGTHTHVPSADTQILPNGTAYQTDAGMCGDFDSVIGMAKEEPIRRFVDKISAGRFSASLGEPTLCGFYVETDDATGLAVHAAPLRHGGRLAPAWPVS